MHDGCAPANAPEPHPPGVVVPGLLTRLKEELTPSPRSNLAPAKHWTPPPPPRQAYREQLRVELVRGVAQPMFPARARPARGTHQCRGPSIARSTERSSAESPSIQRKLHGMGANRIETPLSTSQGLVTDCTHPICEGPWSLRPAGASGLNADAAISSPDEWEREGERLAAEALAGVSREVVEVLAPRLQRFQLN
jgi:hypothetical protein